MAIGVAMAVAVTPAAAHVTANFGHLFNRHFLSAMASLPDCPVNQAIAGFQPDGQPICEMSDVFSTYRDSVETVPSQLVEVARLNLPAGRYLILAKAQAQNNASGSSVRCRLSADGNFDDAEVTIGFRASLSNMVTHEFGNPGPAIFSCSSPNPGTGVWDVKISAIRVGFIENIQIP